MRAAFRNFRFLPLMLVLLAGSWLLDRIFWLPFRQFWPLFFVAIVWGGIRAFRMPTDELLLERWSRLSLLVFAVVCLPLVIFLLSGAMAPEWKGGCAYGWLSCFHVGKLVLTPLVLWSIAALYRLEITPEPRPRDAWIVLGCLTGATVSTLCLGFGMVLLGGEGKTLWWFLLVPLYVTVWYWVRAAQLWRIARPSPGKLALTFLANLSSWAGAAWWAHRVYEKLPVDPPVNCFVVTAAAQGHASVVGPCFPIMRDGQYRQANRQLMRFWRLEARWQEKLPRSHTAFRRIYNHLGPVVARQVSSPWRADAVHLLLKPLEWGAALLCREEF